MVWGLDAASTPKSLSEALAIQCVGFGALGVADPKEGRSVVVCDGAPVQRVTACTTVTSSR